MRRAAAVCLAAAILGGLAAVSWSQGTEGIRGSSTFRAEVVGRVGTVAAGRHFAGEAAMRTLRAGGNAIDAGVAAIFAAAVTEISHFGLGGEVPILIYVADRGQVVVVNGQGPAPAAATPEAFRRGGAGIPTSGPSAGTVPAVVDALALALAEFGTLTLGEVLAPAIELADGFPWYAFLRTSMQPELANIRKYPSGARVYLPGPDGSMPAVGAVFRQPELARTLRALAAAEAAQRDRGRRAAIQAARDVFYRGDIGARIARAVAEAGGLLTADDLARYRGRLEAPTRKTFRTRHGEFEVFKTGFWGQGPMFLQALTILQGFDLERMGHNSTSYIHTVTQALNLALADRDAFYGDPDFARIPATGLLSDGYAVERRGLIDADAVAATPRPGDPWRFEPGARSTAPRHGRRPALVAVADPGHGASPDTTTVNVADARGNLFSASPSSAWFFGGVFIAGDTGVPLGNRMQAFVLDDDAHPNLLQPGKRPRTTLTPTIVRRDGRPYLAFSSPGGDSQDQQGLQVFLNIAVFGMSPQEAIEAPRFNSLQYHESFGRHLLKGSGVLEAENRIAPGVIAALRRLGYQVNVLDGFMMDTGTALVGLDPRHGTLFAAADVRRQRFAAGW